MIPCRMAVIEESIAWLQNWIGTIGTLGSLLLSALLVLLYRQQRDILNEQKELTKATKQAVLRTREFDFIQGSEMEQYRFQYTGYFESWRVHQDYFLLQLSNFGDSPAKNLHFEIRIYFNDSEYLFLKTALSRSVIVPNQMAFNKDTGVIGAGEQNVLFVIQTSCERAEIPDEWTESVSDIPDTVAPSEVMYLASEAGETELEAHLSLSYTDSTGEREPIKIQATRFNPNKYSDLGTAIKRGTYLLD